MKTKRLYFYNPREILQISNLRLVIQKRTFAKTSEIFILQKNLSPFFHSPWKILARSYKNVPFKNVPRHGDHPFFPQKSESFFWHEFPERERDFEILFRPVSRPEPLWSAEAVDLVQTLTNFFGESLWCQVILSTWRFADHSTREAELL